MKTTNTFYGEKKKNQIMIPIEKAVLYKWGKAQGVKLAQRRLEKNLSMPTVSRQLKNSGVNCATSYINKLEKGVSTSVNTEKLLALIAVLDMDIKDF